MYLELLTEGGEENEGSSIIPACWAEANEAELEVLKNAAIEMGDTAYGRHEAQMKRDAEMALKKCQQLKERSSCVRSTRMPARRTSHSHPKTSRQYTLYYVICLLFIHYHNITIGFYFIKWQ
jgi:hypothetical protein